MIAELLAGILILSTCVQLLFWLVGTSRLTKHRDPPVSRAQVPVSLIICVRNEAKNLQANLPAWLAQDHPEFEVVVVDDGSTDESFSILRSFEVSNANLRVIRRERLPADLPGKKKALELGVQAADFEYLVFTDADCVPASETWLGRMASGFDHAELVLGYGPLRESSGWLNCWARYETVHTFITYGAAALWKRPYMGVGRNMGYAKNRFRTMEAHRDLPGGDDDLMVNRMQKGIPTVVVADREAWCWSDASGEWKQYIRQKKRHLQTGVRYRRADQLLLGSLALSHALHYLCAVCLLFWMPLLAGSCLLARLLFVWMKIARLWPRYGQASLVRWFPILDLLHPFYYLFFSPVIFGFGSKNKW